MKRKQKPQELQQLINMIHAATRLRGWTLRETADEIGISHVYLASMTCGARKLSGLALGKQRKLAKFIGISMVDFFLMCGVLCRDDFVAQA
ncbi:MAG: helix-turn-helix transcriptional regulator [Thiobacillus sp.]